MRELLDVLDFGIWSLSMRGLCVNFGHVRRFAYVCEFVCDSL